MSFGMRIVAGWMTFVTILGLVWLGWAIYSGQFDDAETINMIPLNEIEPQDWPGRDGSPKEV